VLCSICGRSAPCEISQATSRPWCRACQKRRARCTGCGQVELIRGGTLTKPLCAACTRPDPSFWRGCPACGQPQLSTRTCTRCNLRQRLAALLAGCDGDVRAELRGRHDNLAGSERPNLVLAWLNKTAIASVLTEFGTGQRAVSHAALDELPASKPIEHLRAILVATRTLPTRDEHLARLERWTARTLAERGDPGQRQLLHRYAVWHLLRRLRQRNNTRYATHAQAVTVQRHVRAAIALLDGLATRGRTLADARQTDLDAWLTSDQASHRRDAGHFARWANRHQLTSLEFPATRWHGPTRTIDTQARWAQARWLLHDHTVNPADRVAGLLVLLYAQTPAAVSRLTLGHVETTGHAVHLRLGREPITLPEPLAGLVADLLPRRRGHAALGDQGTSPGCSPEAAPASRSAPTSSPNACASSDCAPRKAAPPHCSASPPNFPPPCSPGYSASTSRSPSPGNTPPPATGPPTPPTTAAANPPPPKTPNRHFGTRVTDTHSDSWNNRVHQVGPARTSTVTPATSWPPARSPAPGKSRPGDTYGPHFL
jgi:hypothetical protein